MFLGEHQVSGVIDTGYMACNWHTVKCGGAARHGSAECIALLSCIAPLVVSDGGGAVGNALLAGVQGVTCAVGSAGSSECPAGSNALVLMTLGQSVPCMVTPTMKAYCQVCCKSGLAHWALQAVQAS